MKRIRPGRLMRLADMLQDTLNRARATLFGDRVALYLVCLTDEDGFALALRVHERIPGPDPAVLRERALQQAIRAPMMMAAAPVETLAGVTERLPGFGTQARRLLGSSIRSLHAAGEVPILRILDDAAVVEPLRAISQTDALARGAMGAESSEGDDLEIHGWALPGTKDPC